MDIERKEPKLRIAANDSHIACLEELPKGQTIHIIPATAKEQVHDAAVRNYFTPHIHKEGDVLKSTLLGHTLVGKEVTLDNTYEGFLMRNDDELSLLGLRKAGEVVDWRKDRGWRGQDGPS